MGIRYGGREIGEVKATTVHGYAGLGISQLRFSLSWSLHPKRDDLFTVFGTSVWVSARATGESHWLMLGQAVPETAWSDQCRVGDPYERPVLYRLVLPDSQLLAIEDARKGRGMSFQLEVRGHVQGPDSIQSLDSTVMIEANPSDWVRVLKEANVAEVLLVGVQLPPATANGTSRAAIDLVRKANEHMLQGHYEDTVAQCRRAIESLLKAGKLREHARAARKLLATMTERESMTKLDRELALGEALLNFTHPAHHVATNAEPEIFSRLDAALVLAATAGLVSSLAAAPERYTVPASELKVTLAPPAVAKGPEHNNKKDGNGALSAQVLRVRENLAASQPRTMKSLRTAVHSWLGKKLNAQGLDQLMAELQKENVFVEVNGKPKYAVMKK